MIFQLPRRGLRHQLRRMSSSNGDGAIRVERRLNAQIVLEVLADLFLTHGPPKHIRSDNGPELIEKALREWLSRRDVKTLFIEPGGLWENGYCESFNSKLRNVLLAREVFCTMLEARTLIEW